MHIWSRFYQRSLSSLFKTPSTFFLRRTAGNYTTAILNAHPESIKNKAKACSARLTVNPWGSPALPSTLLPAPHPREHPLPPRLQFSARAAPKLHQDWDGTGPIPPHQSVPTTASTTHGLHTPYGYPPHSCHTDPYPASNLGNPCTLTTLQTKIPMKHLHRATWWTILKFAKNR